MSRTKKFMRRGTKRSEKEGSDEDNKKENRAKKQKVDNAPRSYSVKEIDSKQTLVVATGIAPNRDYFQLPSSAEPSQCSLIHAMNNALGLPVLTVEEMFAARAELTEAMKELGEELYLGSDNTGSGDWPVEVAEHALYKKFPVDNIALKSNNFGQKSDFTKKKPWAYIPIVGQHAATADLLVELQYPTSESEEVLVPENKLQEFVEQYDYKTLPIGGNNERTHFIAVRGGLVYDSAVGRTVEVVKYGPFMYTKKLYKIAVMPPAGSGDCTDSADVAVAGDTGKEDDEAVGSGLEDAEGNDNHEKAVDL